MRHRALRRDSASNPRTRRPTFWPVTLAVLSFAFGELGDGPPAQGQITGDIQLLRTAAALWRGNLDRLETWRGRVEFSSERKHGKVSSAVSANIEFAWDKKAAMHSRVIQRTKYVVIVDGIDKSPPLDRHSGVFRDGLYYDLWYSLPRSNPRHLVTVHDHSIRAPDYDSDYFEPSFFLRNGSIELYETWLFVAKNASDVRQVGTVERDGDRVILKQEFTKSHVRGRYEINVAKSGAVGTIMSSGAGVGAIPPRLGNGNGVR